MREGRGPIRLGIAGCGRGTRVHHLPALSRLREFRVTALADPDGGRLADLAGRHGIPGRCRDHRELLRRDDVEAVAVVTPTASHREVARDVLHSGRHLLLEKPVSLDLGEADDLLAAAAAAPGVVLLGFNARWHPLAAEARRIVRSGVLGALRGVQSTYTHHHPGGSAPPWHRDLSLGGGVTFNDAGHHLDLWRHLTGEEILEVGARSLSRGEHPDDTTVLSALLTGGAAGAALLSYSTAPVSRVEVFGTAGVLELDLYRYDGLSLRSAAAYPGSAVTRIRGFASSLRRLPVAVRAAGGGGLFESSYLAMWRHFARCIRGTELPGCTLEDGRRALAAVLAARASAAGGRFLAVGP